MAESYYVDVAAVNAAVAGIRETADAVSVTRVRQLAAPAQAYGHPGLAQAVADFCVRWDAGVEHLRTDVKEIVTRLHEGAAGYELAELQASSDVRSTRQGATPR